MPGPVAGLTGVRTAGDVTVVTVYGPLDAVTSPGPTDPVQRTPARPAAPPHPRIGEDLSPPGLRDRT